MRTHCSVIVSCKSGCMYHARYARPLRYYSSQSFQHPSRPQSQSQSQSQHHYYQQQQTAAAAAAGVVNGWLQNPPTTIPGAITDLRCIQGAAKKYPI